MIIHNMLDVYNQESKNNVLQFPGQEIKIVIFSVSVVFCLVFVLYVEIGNYLWMYVNKHILELVCI